MFKKFKTANKGDIRKDSFIINFFDRLLNDVKSIFATRFRQAGRGFNNNAAGKLFRLFDKFCKDSRSRADFQKGVSLSLSLSLSLARARLVEIVKHPG